MKGPALSKIDPAKLDGEVAEAEGHIMADVWAISGKLEYQRYKTMDEGLASLDPEPFIFFWLLVAHAEGVL